MTLTMHEHLNREALAQSLSLAVGRALSQVITQQGSAVLAVSGGTTPQRFFECLSVRPIAWDKVDVTLVDERQVDETSHRSNARLVRNALLRDAAQRARFVPLYRNEAKARRLALDVVVLGMGADGHTASFFPGGDSLARCLDLHNDDGLVELNAPSAGEPRLTFTLAKIVAARHVFLHIEGAEKRKVLQQAEAGSALPIRAVLTSVPHLQTYWCP